MGTAERAVPTPTTVDESSLEAAGRALELCDRALDLMYEHQRACTVDPGFQDAVCAVEAIRTELAQMRR